MKQKSKTADKGILIYALGHINYYHMAAVLAASIKDNDNLKICLVTDRKINPLHTKLFDIVKAPTKTSVTENGNTEYIKAKLFMADLSPFNETLFLDADQVVILGRKLTPVFDELRNVEITMSNTGIAGESIWADIKEVQEIYGKKPFWNYHSEFLYFKQGEQATKFFNAAKKVYSDNKIKSAKRFSNGNMADELAMQAASIITGIYPHKHNWLPNFWYDRNPGKSRLYPYQLTGYLTYSIGGHVLPASVKNNYNTLAKHYFAKQSLSGPYQVEDKRSFLPERKLV